MAVDSREKRFSFLNFGDGSHLHATFEADGTVDLDDRQHLLDCYSGIAFAVGGIVQQIITIRGKLNTALSIRGKLDTAITIRGEAG